jgi:hypothetical protein
MRICKKCKVSKPLTEFYERGYKSKDGPKTCHSRTCATCTIEAAVDNRRAKWDSKYKHYHKEFYSTRPAKAREIACRDRLREQVNASKNGPCTDCKRTFPPVCMDYDHRNPEEKREEIAQLVAKRHCWETIEAEIAKCDLVCACCHRLRTAKMLDWK